MVILATGKERRADSYRRECKSGKLDQADKGPMKNICLAATYSAVDMCCPFWAGAFAYALGKQSHAPAREKTLAKVKVG